MSGEEVDNGTVTQVATETPTATADWKAGLPDDVKAGLEKFTTVEALAKSYMNAETLIGREKIPMPKTPEEWESAYTRLGRPENPDGYELKVAQDIAEKVKDLNQEDSKWFKDVAHKAGLNKQQAEMIFGEYWKMAAGNHETLQGAIAGERAEAEMSLKKEWLTAYDHNLGIANKALSHISQEAFGDDSLVTHLADRGLSNDPVIVKLMHHVGTKVLEDTSLVGGGVSSKEVDKRISDIQANPGYFDKKHPSHAALVREMNDLFSLKHPGMVA